jgi:hypothetical protein
MMTTQRLHDADARQHGVAAVWTQEIAAVFKERDVIYLADNDKPGRDKVAREGEALTGVARSIRIASCRSPAERCGQRGYFVGAGS